MSEVVGDSTPHTACSLPPQGFCEAELTIRELDPSKEPIYRIHRRGRDPIFYNRQSLSATRYRFDAPNDCFGVLYDFPSFDACMAETIMRGRFQGLNMSHPRLIDERDIALRSVSVLDHEASRALRFADLTVPLWHIGFDVRALSINDYRVPNLWSAAIHGNRAKVDGIYFRSRYANAPSIAVFSDRAKLVARKDAVPLSLHAGLPAFLDKFNIGIADSAGEHWRNEDAF